MKSRIIPVLILAVLALSCTGMLNPAYVYCSKLGYTPVEVDTPEGVKIGCVLPGGEVVGAWSFLKGEVAGEYSYCARQGYEIVYTEDSSVCPGCGACVMPDGSLVDVKDLMNLSVRETTCGDGHCGFPENPLNCPGDCPSGRMDDFCDGIGDGVCDPDCEFPEDVDPDCVLEDVRPIPHLKVILASAGILVLTVVLVLAVVGAQLLRR